MLWLFICDVVAYCCLSGGKVLVMWWKSVSDVIVVVDVMWLPIVDDGHCTVVASWW